RGRWIGSTRTIESRRLTFGVRVRAAGRALSARPRGREKRVEGRECGGRGALAVALVRTSPDYPRFPTKTRTGWRPPEDDRPRRDRRSLPSLDDAVWRRAASSSAGGQNDRLDPLVPPPRHIAADQVHAPDP